MKIGRYLPIVILICIGFGFATADAEENLAQEAYAIFQQSCLICHGPHGSFTEQLVIQSSQALIDTGKVIPGDPDNSIFYQRLIETAVERRMPLGQPALAPAAIETIRQWIQAGAPDWNAFDRTDINFITTEEMLETIENHINALSPFDRSFARYFTSTHLYNAGESLETLNAYRRALSKLVNSLSWGREVIKPQPIDPQETIFYIDLRDYEWEIGTNRWTLIETEYPYKVEFDAPGQTHLHEKLTNLREEMSCDVPFVHVDWFLATASLPPLYHDILDLPLTDRELETRLEVNVVENIRKAPGRRVWRAGFNNSGVSNHNRVVERHLSRYGAYWKSYDFAGSVGTQNIFTHPLSFTHDGGEIIFNLPNGLQAYYLADAGGSRLDEAPINIVSNPAASDPTVRNGLSCIGCHTEGMKTFEDQVRGVVEQNANPPYDKAQALRLYVEKSEMDTLVEEDTNRYRQALEATGDVFGGIEPVQRFHEAFQAPLDASHAAASVGLEIEIFLGKIRGSASLQNLGLQVLENGTMKRDAWTSNFDAVISVLNTPDSVLPPVVERPERIPGAGVYIPDDNLRAAIEETLDKAPNAVITAEDMATLIELNAANMGISDITGLEFATHLQRLVLGFEFATNSERIELKGNQISDISPLAGLINLERLELNGNQISDISPLTGLINLERLELRQNQISDISPLAGLINLLSLNIRQNPLSDISPLASAIKLEFVEVSDTLVSDISPLAELKNLHKFSSWSSPISDISPLTHLTIIDMCGAPISDISSLAEAKNLRELYLFKCNISDVSPLTELAGLTRLDLERNNISDISPLGGLTNLKWLKLTNNPIIDFSPLAELFENTNILFDVTIPDVNLRAVIAEALKKEDADTISITLEEMATLTTLRASNRDIKDLTGIEYAINLEEMWISGNPITDLSPFARLTNFIGLHAWETSVSDLSPLAGLTKLRWLDFGRTPISDISPLASIVSLRKLTFYACNIKDISPLAGLTGLTHLEIGGNRDISDASPISRLINLEHLDFHHDSISDLQPLATLINLKSLNLYNNRLISNLTPLSGLTSLIELDLGQNMVSDVSPLSSLIGLTKLDLGENMIADVSPLASLFNLEKLILHTNLITNISDLAGLSVFPRHINWVNNPGAPIAGRKIVGPWLWMLIPGKRLDSSTDLLASVSNGSVTEDQIAMNGATEGAVVGNHEWTSHKISTEGKNGDIARNNMKEMLHAFGLTEESETQDNVVYGSVLLYAPREQETRMLVGSEGQRKVWLNGNPIHELLGKAAWDYDSSFDQFFSVTLKKGANVLLVAVDRGHWITGHFSFEEGTEYKLIPPSVGFTFSATETDLLAGDMFTLNLNTKNITDLAGWQADITFDPDVLEATEVSEGDFLKTEDGSTFFQDGTIDNTIGKITDLFSARISESGVSGTGTLLSVTFKAKAGGETQVTLENFEFSSISGEVIPSVPPNITITVGEYPPWDVNQDGRVSVVDLVLVAKDFGSDAPANLRTDVNRDGIINIQDLILVAQHLGESTDAAAPPVIAAINNGQLTPAIIQTWIAQARVEDDGSIAFRQGIANLEQLLTLFIPEETALFHNYPNPFNPETWIPYQLAEPAEVTLTIHAVNGTLVRTLTLGYQPAGIYQTRTRAAYWDGKNDLGEKVASGVYFYTLTAGDFNTTRKMLIRK